MSCDQSNACYKWTPAAQWEPFEADLLNDKWAHIMVTAPRFGGSSDERVPIVLGQNRATEIFNPETNEWEEYEELDNNNWNAIQCLVHYQDRVYQIGGGTVSQYVFELDLTTWTTTQLGEKLDFINSPGTCAIATIDGVPGIMIGNGYWFNIVERTWEAKRFPPYYDGGLQPNSLANFRGKATLFGTQSCDENEQCDYNAVYQYEDSSDQWRYLGQTVHSRTLHEIIEVPKSFCDVVTNPPPSTETAAMIIGGVGALEPGSRRDILQSVELFGCPGRDSFLIDNYPKSLYLHAGNYYEKLDRDEEEATGTVLVCGGFACEDPVADDPCRNSPECYEWTPENRWQIRPEVLPEDKWAFMMASVIDMYSGSNTEVPLVLGEGEETYVYDYLEGEWQSYDILEMRNWFSLQCFVQHENTIYHIQTQIHALDTLTWETRMIGEVPEALANHPGRCAISVINGETGKIYFLPSVFELCVCL